MDLRLTKENLWNALDDNMLDRNTEVKEFVQMLDKRKEARIFAINGVWGCGKTFFIRQVCEILDYDYQKKRNVPLENDRDFEWMEEIIGRHKELQIMPLNRHFITIYYDAWLHDDHEDPLLSLIYEIESRYKELCSGPAGADASFEDTFEVLKSWIEKKRGLRSIAEAEKMKEDFRKLLGILYEKKLDGSDNGRVLIVIDELDRCKPDYAVKVLERIKHFVDLEKVFFVYCLNKVELCKSIECFYGRNLESTMYLNKFFDITYDLNIKDVCLYYLQMLGELPNNPELNAVIPSLARYLNFSLRECNQFTEVMGGCLSVGEADDEVILISKNIFYPIIAALRISNAQKCQDFLGGRAVTYLEKMYDEVEEIRQAVDRILKKSSVEAGKRGLVSAYNTLFHSGQGSGNMKKMRDILQNLLYDRGDF